MFEAVASVLRKLIQNLSLMIMIETPLSVLNIQEICAASSKVEVSSCWFK